MIAEQPVAFALADIFRMRDCYRSAIVIPCSLIIAAMGLF